jgi:hypothetical protein
MALKLNQLFFGRGLRTRFVRRVVDDRDLLESPEVTMLGPPGEYSCVSDSGIRIPFWQYGHFRVSPARSSETLSDFWQCGQGNLKYVVIKESNHREGI